METKEIWKNVSGIVPELLIRILRGFILQAPAPPTLSGFLGLMEAVGCFVWVES